MKENNNKENHIPSIFLSHTWADKPFVRRLASDLVKFGARVWLDEGEIKLGDSLIEKIRAGIDEMDYLAVVLSPNSINSEWVKKEVDIAMNQEIDNRRIKVLPLLYMECDLPGFLKGKLYANFTDHSQYDDSLRLILERLGLSTEALSNISKAKIVLGIKPEDKVLIDIGFNKPELLIKETYFIDNKGFSLTTAGWGEVMALPRILMTLNALGVKPSNISFNYSGPKSSFDPLQYSDHHIVFLGSIRSNSLLQEYFWDKLALHNRYGFGFASLSVTSKDNPSLENTIEYYTNENISEEVESISVIDHFLFAKVPNPYSSVENIHYCILLCGTGTIGTGYAGILFSTRVAIDYLYEKYADKTYEIVCRVEMRGMFNPSYDPISLVFDGTQQVVKTILPGNG